MAATSIPAKRAGNGLLVLLSLCLVLNAAMYLHTTSCAHRVQLHLVGQQQQQRARSPNTSSVDVAGSAFSNDLRLNVSTWLAFAAADAAQHGLHISEACDTTLGEGFLRRFSSTWGTLCGGATTQPQSSVQCAAYPVERLGLACTSKQLLLNATAFMGPAVPKGQQEHDKYMPQGPPGSVSMDCHTLGTNDSVPGSRSVWQSGAAPNLQKELLPWFKHAAHASSKHTSCDGASRVVGHPVLFVTRLDTTNPYHHTQSLVQAFLTLAVVQNNTRLPSLQVVLADHFDPGPFTAIWGRLSSPHTVVSLDGPAFAGGNTCISRGIHAHYVGPGRAFLGYEGIGSEKPCASTILMAFAHWQRYLFKDMLLAHEQQAYRQLEVGGPLSLDPPSSHHRFNVVWLSRSWFSKSMKAGGGLTGWQASRDLSHEQESDIVRALQQAVMDWNSKACAPPVFGWWQRPHAVPKPSGCKAANVSFDFHSVDLSVQDLYPEQVMLLTRTAVLASVHGAALTNQVWMRPHRGAVVEFGAGGNFHYVNMAHMLGHKHFQASSSAAQLADAVTQGMDHVSSKY